jgi:glutamyl-tRNA(Gln) amidotransferase subunit D
MTIIKNLKPGNKVEIKTKDKLLRGILMERPELADNKYLVIKLESGYNVGLKKSEIKEIKAIKTREKGGKKESKVIKKDLSKKTVSIISTGGTISSRVDYRTGGVYASFTAEDLLESHPELKNFANIETIDLMNVMSEDMHPKLWVKIAKAIHRELNSENVAGVVVTHGTDTMAYTSAALSFILGNLGKPIALTGSQRSSDRGSADSFMNLICSVIFSSSKYSGIGVVMHGSMSDEFCFLHSGVKVRKMHTTRRDAFQTINGKPLAKIYPNGKIILLGEVPNRSDNKKIKFQPKLEEKVALIKIYPGMDSEIINFYIDKKFKGIVFEGTALGHVPTTIPEKSLIPKIERAKEEGIIMAMTSQCLYGRVNPYVYSNLRKVSSRGVIYCEDMLPETAYVKLMWVLGQTKDEEKVREMMLKNYVGEISERSEIKEDVVPNFP